ncbi:MAG: FAD-dependent oxidoreductase, partial [Candidatus Krumholzibacteria bacterium]|nr:FAD-dependent oxidoreductase [Candidatus Krumholzibacteria bacterium]
SFTEERIPLLNILSAIKTTTKKMAGRLFQNEKAAEPTYSTQLYYPREGLMIFFNCLKETIIENNGIIHLNSKIGNLQIIDNKARTISFESDGIIQSVDCDYVISTIPINELIMTLTPNVEESIYSVANSLRFRALIFVNLLVERDEVFEAQWIYFRNSTFNRVSEMNKFSREIVPEGKSALVAEITCNKGDEIWDADEGDLCERVIKELEEEGIISRDEIIDAFVTRKEHGYPVADLDFERNRKELYDYVNSIDNVFVTGRQGLFRYLQMDHCMKLGYSIADQILSETPKITS